MRQAYVHNLSIAYHHTHPVAQEPQSERSHPDTPPVMPNIESGLQRLPAVPSI